MGTEILNTIKSYMKAEIKNKIQFHEDMIILTLNNGVKLKVTAKNVA